ncbi:MAG: tyrosine-type recombinase/integrase, partial [Frankiaceae bacterium]|nr:tyrosine-type recombinase/integrase [Frankiaceae bacterium]
HSVTLRSFYRWAAAAELIGDDPSARLPAVRVPPGKPRPAPNAVVRRSLDESLGRVRLMLMLGAHAGLRRAEIARVHADDLVDGLLRVTGKGGRTRLVPVSEDLAAAIAAAGGGYLFPGQVDGHMSAGHVGRLMAAALEERWTAHTLRHAFATKAYAVDRDLLAVQELLGHTSPTTTARYAAVPSDAMRRAVTAAATT